MYKLQRVITRCYQFKDKTFEKKNTNTKAITVKQLEWANWAVIKIVQQEAFSEDFEDRESRDSCSEKANYKL